jgi:rSAM/selenodomain-associated transferase 2
VADYSIGIVLPVLNESTILHRALGHLKSIAGEMPVVVVDGGSVDGSAAIAQGYYPTEVLPIANRGAQMNHGAEMLDTEVLLFLHADSELPSNFATQIHEALRDDAVQAGCFRLRFDHPHPLLRFYAWFTMFSSRFFHYGDQAFFVRRSVFNEIGRYPDTPILEDVEFLRRLRKHGRFSILKGEVKTSSRRFLRHGIVRQQVRNIFIVILFELGIPASRLKRLYPNIR